MFAFLLLLKFWTRKSALERLGIPTVGGSRQHTKDFERLVEEGYYKVRLSRVGQFFPISSHHSDRVLSTEQQYPHSPYAIKTQGLEYVVFPPEAFDEIKKLPPHIASAQDFFVKTYFGHYTTAGTETPALLKAISVDLARSMPLTVASRQEDAKAAADDVLGFCPEWKEVSLFPAVTRMIAMTNACSLVGRSLARSEGWIGLVSRFPFEVMAGTFAISVFPRFLQPVLAPLIFLPALVTKWRMKWSLRGVVQRDMQEYQSTSDKKMLLTLKEDGKVPFTAALMTRYKPSEATLSQLLHDYVTVSFESTPSSTAALYLILMELATRPQLVEVLRQELNEVMVDGMLPRTHLAELRKMDSVMRESARANPFSLLALYRLLRVPTKLSTGPTLPAGTLICVDVHHIHTSEDRWTKPQDFDGLRFHEIRKTPGKENTYQFVSTGADSPGWGDGAMACPGRMFANSTLKIALAHLIMHYDFRFADGEGKPIKTSLPNGSWNPGLKVRVLFKSRKWDA
ncbi:cytochrome P450 oxidoreductase GliF [Aspergillus heteromorphus CBS 117.55]|uniref:Cytochrome P450 oxidoreductase GliF n=1 Tax=Aspergillus heteromorphus CBS 117.55 TaxID=1448321 RepID=A0A317W7N0_9EURO|nr:cytochrome P450 oxidoreductase GliF [Aspergillus heteromorphus CBS 117.55]PWY81895.1 cytochrome P450 oxidoreductase GliF [Aspergillus heteromorphus CBS 117.55]